METEESHPQPKGTPDHVPVSSEQEAETDAKLGIELLPPIRVPAVTAALIKKFAALEGVIVQAIVRDVLVERFSVGGTTQAPAPAPAPVSEYAEVDDKLLTGQAQYLIAALMNHGLLPGKTLPEDKYLKLWDVVKAQLRCVHREAVRAVQAPVVQAWQPIETAPFDEDLLTFHNSGRIAQDYRSRQYENNWTHWLPLPAEPESDVPVQRIENKTSPSEERTK